MCLLVLVPSTGATAYLITQQAQQAREVEKMATVAQVSVQQIQALAYASEQYNVSGESMADILKDVNDKLGDFTENEGGQFADFMTNIAPTVGLTIDQLQKLSGPEALVAVKAAMGRSQRSNEEPDILSGEYSETMPRH